MAEHRIDREISWDRLPVFLAVAESGSFTKAGRKLDLSQSAVSRQIAALEESLKVFLFHRHTRKLVLTEQGEEFHRAVAEMANRLSFAIARINEIREQPEGSLRIATTVTFGSAWLTSRINQFHLQFPDVSVSLILSDAAEPDLSQREADVAIRFSRQTQPNIIQRKLLSTRYRLYASADYLRRHGVPKTPADLDRHELIVYGEDAPQPLENMNWILEVGSTPGRRRKPALRVNSVYGIYRAVKSGLGIAALPYYLSEESPELVMVLPELKGPAIDAYFAYPEELRHSKRIAVLRDFLLEQAEADQKGQAEAPR
jgi:DNA-binding transcriptional LysR family regulator